MDREDLGRELFDIHQSMKSEVGALKIEAALAAPDLAGHVAAYASKLAALVERAERVVAGYIASMDSGATKA